MIKLKARGKNLWLKAVKCGEKRLNAVKHGEMRLNAVKSGKRRLNTVNVQIL